MADERNGADAKPTKGEMERAFDAMSTEELKAVARGLADAYRERFRSRIYVVFMGFEPFPPEEQPPPLADGSRCTGRSAWRTFGPYYEVVVSEESVYVRSVISRNPDDPGDDEGEEFYLATKEEGEEGWKLQDGLEEKEDGPTYTAIMLRTLPPAP